MARPISDDLFKLIKSLTRNEKRYFKVFSSLHIIGEKNSYIKLFDIVDKQTEYDEQSIIKKYGHETFVKNIARSKHYLYQQVLKSLHVFHLESSLVLKFKYEMSLVEILFEKRLFEQGRKVLKNTKNVAQQVHAPIITLDVLKLERRAFTDKHFFKNPELKISRHLEEERKTLQDLDSIITNWGYRIQTYSVIATEGVIRGKQQDKKLKQIINSLKNQDLNQLPFNAKINHYNTLASYYDRINDSANALKYDNLALSLLESDKSILSLNIGLYITTLANAIMMSARYSKATYEELIDKLQTLYDMKPLNNLGQPTSIFFYYHLLMLQYYIDCGQTTGIEKHIEVMSSAIEQYKAFDSKIRIIYIYYILFYASFTIESYTTALVWLNKVLDSKETAELKDLKAISRMVNLILHYELSNTILLSNIIKPTYRYLVKAEKLYTPETLVLKFLRQRSHKLESRNELVNSFKKLLVDIEEVMSQNTPDKNMLLLFDIPSWLESKIKSKPFTTIVQEKYKART